MTLSLPRRIAAATLLAAMGAGAQAQVAASPQPSSAPQAPAGMRIPPQYLKMMKAQEARLALWRTKVPPGTGPYPIIRNEERGLPGHTIYRPANLAKAPRLPVVAFGNGGCRNTSIEFAGFLAEIASRGYLVVAVGTDDVPFVGMMAGPTPPGGKPAQRAEVAALTEAVDWAVAENRRRGSAYRGRIRIDRVAYVGQSCGGLQALSASADPRTTTTVVLNSGYFSAGAAPRGVAMPERLPWTAFHAPVAFFTGGKSDIAYANAYANFREAQSVPMFIASRNVGHSDAYPAPDMPWTLAVVSWLDWQLKGDRTAAARFVGSECGLCRDPAWSEVSSKLLPTQAPR